MSVAANPNDTIDLSSDSDPEVEDEDIIVLSSDSEPDDPKEKGAGDAKNLNEQVEVTPRMLLGAKENCQYAKKIAGKEDVGANIKNQTASADIVPVKCPDFVDDQIQNVSPTTTTLTKQDERIGLGSPPPIIIRKVDDILSSQIASIKPPIKLQESSRHNSFPAASPPEGDNAPIEVNRSSPESVPELPDSASKDIVQPKATAALEKLIEALKSRIPEPAQFERVETKVQKYCSPKFTTDAADADACQAIEECLNQILESDNNELTRNLKLKALFKYFKNCRKNPSVSKAQAEDARKKRKILILEKRLASYERKIEEMDQRDDDWDDDVNSPYLIKTRMVNRYMQAYGTLCKIAGCNTYTDRPTQRKISLKDVSRFPEIESEVQAFINSEYLFNTPDFRDILRIAEKAKSDHNLILDSSQVHSIALELFHTALRKVKWRRQKDSHLALKLPADHGFDTLRDPADDDEELARKLEENRLKRRSEADVLKEFAAKEVEDGLVPEEVPDDLADLETSGDEDSSENDLAEGIIEDIHDEHDKPCTSKSAQQKVLSATKSDSEDTSDSDSDSITVLEQGTESEPLSKKRKT